MPVCANRTAAFSLKVVTPVLSLLRKEISTAQGQKVTTIFSTGFNQVAFTGVAELTRQDRHFFTALDANQHILAVARI